MNVMGGVQSWTFKHITLIKRYIPRRKKYIMYSMHMRSFQQISPYFLFFSKKIQRLLNRQYLKKNEMTNE